VTRTAVRIPRHGKACLAFHGSQWGTQPINGNGGVTLSSSPVTSPYGDIVGTTARRAGISDTTGA